METISFKPIGMIHSAHKKPEGTPIQFGKSNNSPGEIEIFPEFTEGLSDLDGFSHIMLFYHFHLIKETKLTVKPFMDDFEHGIFATRSPARPNPIGFSVVRIIEIKNSRILVEGLDMIDGTPLLDIKPYVTKFDAIEVQKIGWLENNVHKHTSVKDDGRFL